MRHAAFAVTRASLSDVEFSCRSFRRPVRCRSELRLLVPPLGATRPGGIPPLLPAHDGGLLGPSLLDELEGLASLLCNSHISCSGLVQARVASPPVSSPIAPSVSEVRALRTPPPAAPELTRRSEDGNRFSEPPTWRTGIRSTVRGRPVHQSPVGSIGLCRIGARVDCGSFGLAEDDIDDGPAGPAS